MATSKELAERLYRRFNGVPNFTEEVAQALIDDSLSTHGLSPDADIPLDQTNRVLLFAQSEGAWQVAFSVAHYFKYTDGEESVDKSMVSDNYRQLAKDLREDYDAEINPGKGSIRFTQMTRIDRP